MAAELPSDASPGMSHGHTDMRCPLGERDDRGLIWQWKAGGFMTTPPSLSKICSKHPSESMVNKCDAPRTFGLELGAAPQICSRFHRIATESLVGCAHQMIASSLDFLSWEQQCARFLGLFIYALQRVRSSSAEWLLNHARDDMLPCAMHVHKH